MAKLLSVALREEGCDKTITKALQSGNINFLIGSGASLPAIPIAGGIESELNLLLEGLPADYENRKHTFLCDIQGNSNAVLTNNLTANQRSTLDGYGKFLEVLGKLLEERKTNLLTKQVSIFTTNYDVFIEAASQQIVSVRLNDGFNRTPSLSNDYKFQPEHFFDYLQKTGNLYNYSFPVPGINLVKLHGSLTWGQKNNEIIFHSGYLDVPKTDDGDYEEKKATFNNAFCLILPTKDKFNQTLMVRVYYDLLRIFANALEIMNSVLFTFGFSFEDEHILEIVRRSLKNPTLILIVFAYDHVALASYQAKFEGYNNVLIIHPEADGVIDFTAMIKLFSDVIPKINDEH